MARLHPGAKAFREHVLSEFAFLLKEFGFEQGARIKGNDFRIDVVNATTRIVVEGTGWGSTAGVAFRSREAPAVSSPSSPGIRRRWPADRGSMAVKRRADETRPPHL